MLRRTRKFLYWFTLLGMLLTKRLSCCGGEKEQPVLHETVLVNYREDVVTYWVFNPSHLLETSQKVVKVKGKHYFKLLQNEPLEPVLHIVLLKNQLFKIYGVAAKPVNVSVGSYQSTNKINEDFPLKNMAPESITPTVWYT